LNNSKTGHHTCPEPRPDEANELDKEHKNYVSIVIDSTKHVRLI